MGRPGVRYRDAAGDSAGGRDRKLQPGDRAASHQPEPGNWLLYRRTYDGHGYSPLDQINTNNVKNLTPVWTFSTGVNEGHQSPPIVNNVVMFITTPQAQVIALDAKSGQQIWRYKRQLPDDLFQLHPTNRGVGLWHDKLYLATTDDYLVALDAKTGKSVWETKVGDYKTGTT
jgi:alcohol dehydrogenase (cytochrome c)